ncbi:MAG: alpha/beta hydrolase [Eubacteriaceae bacterium]|nr:alpha/beta hydrolase [Eubacteriaceae bacterium]
MDRKLAVFFPGAGYHNDKPLMYYSKKAAHKHGFDLIELTFELSGAASSVKKDRQKLKEALGTAYSQAEEGLGKTDLASFDRVVFVGKSIGTAVMARYCEEHGIDADMIIFTPIAETFDHPNLRGEVFCGSADPMLDKDTCLRLCGESSLHCTVTDGANHSLETGDVLKDIENLGMVISAADRIFSRA